MKTTDEDIATARAFMEKMGYGHILNNPEAEQFLSRMAEVEELIVEPFAAYVKANGTEFMFHLLDSLVTGFIASQYRRTHGGAEMDLAALLGVRTEMMANTFLAALGHTRVAGVLEELTRRLHGAHGPAGLLR